MEDVRYCEEIQIAICKKCTPLHFAAASRWYYKSKQGKQVTTCPSCLKRYPPEYAAPTDNVKEYLCKIHFAQYK